MKKVSFDFDDTLSDSEEVQNYAKELVERGYEVHIVTTRYENPKDYDYPALTNNMHDGMFAIADRVGIKRENIHFTNMQYKYDFFNKYIGYVFHLDNNIKEVDFIRNNGCSTSAVLFAPWNKWKEACDSFLNKEL